MATERLLLYLKGTLYQSIVATSCFVGNVGDERFFTYCVELSDLKFNWVLVAILDRK